MAFFKPIYKKLSKKWHPQAVSVGKPIEMDELCKQIALISTVSSAHQSYPRSPRPCAGDMYEHWSHGTRGGSGNLLLHLHLHRQRRGRGRKGERQPNLRHPRTFRARVASARYHHHARPHRRKRDVGKYQLHQPVGRHRQWRQQRRRRWNRGKSVGITETELRCDNRAGGEHGTHAPLRPPPMQREEQQQTGGQLFAVVLFRNELILRGIFR